MFKGSSVSSYGQKEEKISDSEASKLKDIMKSRMQARRVRLGLGSQDTKGARQVTKNEVKKQAKNHDKEPRTGLKKWGFVAFNIVSPVIAIIFAWQGYQQNMENSQKVNALLIKYEQTLDKAIASDKSSLSSYRENVEKTLESLSPQERDILKAVLELSEDE
ncbi:hypothetical protein [Alteromonas mediterranea]|uniref:hypothetical protein n=1 Tax=Alteromonas mediterranea TaxID=314275 RepID=UPI002FE2476A|tara:strand:- start:9054 stop:9539 length:486 start_codon:yes stop_codon:yes gene_type:complete